MGCIFDQMDEGMILMDEGMILKEKKGRDGGREYGRA
jgi:hypothetical protein